MYSFDIIGSYTLITNWQDKKFAIYIVKYKLKKTKKLTFIGVKYIIMLVLKYIN